MAHQLLLLLLLQVQQPVFLVALQADQADQADKQNHHRHKKVKYMCMMKLSSNIEDAMGNLQQQIDNLETRMATMTHMQEQVLKAVAKISAKAERARADEQAQLRHQLETSRVELESKTKAVEQSRSEQSLARLAAEQDLQRLAEEHAAKLRQAEAGKRLLGACSSVCQTDPKRDLRSFATVLPGYQFEPTVAVPANTH